MAMRLYDPTDSSPAVSSFDLMPKAMKLAETVSSTDFVPKGLRNNPPAILAAILTGHEIGLPPMAALSHIYVIEGRPTLSATAMRALILSRGHELWFDPEPTVTRCVMHARRRGSERVNTVTYTLDDARRAQLDHKDNWRKNPRAMLMARATGEMARAIFADVIGGIPYTTEEVQDMGETVAQPPAEQSAPAAPAGRLRRATRAATAPAEPPPAPEPVPEPAATQAGSQTTAEPPPAPAPEPPPLPKAGTKVAGESLTLAQQIAMLCRELGIERANLLQAVTGKTSGREITRDQALAVLEAARAVSRGELQLLKVRDSWELMPADESLSAAPEATPPPAPLFSRASHQLFERLRNAASRSQLKGQATQKQLELIGQRLRGKEEVLSAVFGPLSSLDAAQASALIDWSMTPTFKVERDRIVDELNGQEGLSLEGDEA